MAVANFTATRSLAAGYTLGQSVTIQFGVMRADPKPGVIFNEKTSLGGATRRNVNRFENKYMLTTTPFAGTARSIFEMFLESVKAGEQFTANWEEDGTPILKPYKLQNAYTPERVFLQTFKYSFEAREL